jgi:hypothetical protein
MIIPDVTLVRHQKNRLAKRVRPAYSPIVQTVGRNFHRDRLTTEQ